MSPGLKQACCSTCQGRRQMSKALKSEGLASESSPKALGELISLWFFVLWVCADLKMDNSREAPTTVSGSVGTHRK